MRKSFFFFELELPPEVEDIPPLYGETVSDIERHLKDHGIEVVNMNRVRIDERKLYRGSIYGIDYRYGYFIDDGVLVFLFTIPLSLKMIERYPARVRAKIEERLRRGFVEREFFKLDGFQFEELVSGKLYVGTEW